MRAVHDAVELGFSYIEVDVQTSADGKVVVFHDEQLDRITTGTGKLSQYTWAELSTLTVIGPHPRQEEVAEPLVLFEDLLEAFALMLISKTGRLRLRWSKSFAALEHGIACSLRHFEMLIVDCSSTTFKRKIP